MSDKKKIHVSDIKKDLSNGLTRKVGATGYNAEVGSIEEKYGLTKTEVDKLFKYSKLKGLKTKFPKEDTFEIVDDEPVAIEETAPVAALDGATNGSNVAEEPQEEKQPEGQAGITTSEEPIAATTEESAS